MQCSQLLLGIHFRRTAEIVVAADDVQRREGDVADCPTQILTVLGELRILGLAFDRNGALAQTTKTFVSTVPNLLRRIRSNR